MAPEIRPLQSPCRRGSQSRLPRGAALPTRMLLSSEGRPRGRDTRARFSSKTTKRFKDACSARRCPDVSCGGGVSSAPGLR